MIVVTPKTEIFTFLCCCLNYIVCFYLRSGFLKYDDDDNDYDDDDDDDDDCSPSVSGSSLAEPYNSYILYCFTLWLIWLHISRFMASSIFIYQRCVGFSSRSRPPEFPAPSSLHPPRGLQGPPACQTQRDNFALYLKSSTTQTQGLAMATIQISSERSHSLAALNKHCIVILVSGSPLGINKDGCQI